MIKSISTFLAMAIVSLLSLNTFAQVLDVDTFEKKIQQTPNAYLLDVRTTGEFGGGHLPNAMNIEDDEVKIHNFHYGGGGAPQTSTGKNRTRKANGMSGGPVQFNRTE